ncbi:MAG: hypothetical protein C0466_10885 [Candidatus Accumulibacter sp.]|nr:hypothetical protein [Accumulibacter sp.]
MAQQVEHFRVERDDARNVRVPRHLAVDRRRHQVELMAGIGAQVAQPRALREAVAEHAAEHQQEEHQEDARRAQP